MTAKPVLLAAAALALVSGCSGGGADNGAAGGNNSTAAGSDSAAGGSNSAAGGGAGAANSATANMAGSSGAASGPVDRAFVVGHWGVSNCQRTLSFNADGSVAGGTIDPTSRWTLEGSTLTVREGNGPPEPATATREGDRLRLSGPQGQRITLTRCPAAASVAPPAGAGGAPPVPRPSN